MLDQESLKFIFGIKLKALRKDKNYSLKQLSEASGLSPSYLNEIEKGKKYPKSEKIMLLADKLDVEYDELISVKLRNQFQPLTKIFENRWLKGLPLEVFGIPADKVVELVAEQPERTSALFGTLLDIARINNININDFYYAALRAYIDRNKNDFPELENGASDFRDQFLDGREGFTSDELIQCLQSEFNLKVQLSQFAQKSAELAKYDHYRVGKELFLNSALPETHLRFLLARELGYAVLGLEKSQNCHLKEYESYGQLHRQFQASYFAGALCISEETMVDQLELFMMKRTWNPQLLQSMLEKCNVPVKTMVYRILQILPRHFEAEKAYFLQFGSERRNHYRIEKDLQLSAIYAPSRAVSSETYCRRWLSIQSIDEIRKYKTSKHISMQRSRYFGTNNEYLNFAIASPVALNPSKIECVTFGILLDGAMEKRIRFSTDKTTKVTEVAGNCERCGIRDCEVRVEPPRVLQAEEERVRVREQIGDLKLN